MRPNKIKQMWREGKCVTMGWLSVSNGFTALGAEGGEPLASAAGRPGQHRDGRAQRAGDGRGADEARRKSPAFHGDESPEGFFASPAARWAGRARRFNPWDRRIRSPGIPRLRRRREHA